MAGVYVHRQREVSQSLPLMVSSLSLYDQRDMRTAGKVRSETLVKLNLGRAWQEQAGPGYRYFLVFQDKDISMTGAYPMSEFLKILAEL